MTRFYIEAIWSEDGVGVELHAIEPLPPGQAQRMIQRGTLNADDEQVTRRRIGEFTVAYPEGAFPMKVRRRALDWLAEHAGMTAADSFELQRWTQETGAVLARLEAAAARTL